jgi:hypothetical protein
MEKAQPFVFNLLTPEVQLWFLTDAIPRHTNDKQNSRTNKIKPANGFVKAQKVPKRLNYNFRIHRNIFPFYSIQEYHTPLTPFTCSRM